MTNFNTAGTPTHTSIVMDGWPVGEPIPQQEADIIIRWLNDNYEGLVLDATSDELDQVQDDLDSANDRIAELEREVDAYKLAYSELIDSLEDMAQEQRDRFRDLEVYF